MFWCKTGNRRKIKFKIETKCPQLRVLHANYRASQWNDGWHTVIHISRSLRTCRTSRCSCSSLSVARCSFMKTCFGRRIDWEANGPLCLWWYVSQRKTPNSINKIPIDKLTNPIAFQCLTAHSRMLRLITLARFILFFRFLSTSSSQNSWAIVSTMHLRGRV